jgi:hypothetical protein
MALMIENNKPGWDAEKDFIPQTQARRRHEATQQMIQADYAERMLGAFTVRAEQGPPLNQIEADLVRFLIEHAGSQTRPTE